MFEFEPASSPPFDATAARALATQAQSLNGQYLRKETDEVITAIKIAAAAGKTSITTSHTDQVIRNRLLSLGFRAVIKPGDQRDSAYMDVNW